MIKAAVVILVLACLTICQAQSTCNVTITVGQRVGASWYVGTTRYQIYDIVVRNEGTCPLTSLIGLFTPTTGFISETWNYDAPSGQIRGYGAIAAGQSFFDAGFVLANSTSAPTLTTTRPSCPGTCSTATTMAPTSSPPTSGPSTVPPTSGPSTVPPTSVPSTVSPSTNAPASCYATITASARQGGSWDAGAIHYQIYELAVVNTGTCPLTTIIAKFSTGAGSITQAWNYDALSGVIMGFGSALSVGQTYNSAGLVLANSAQLTLAQTSFICSASCAPTTTAPSTVSPSTAPPSTTVPSTVTPSTATPSTTTPSTATPSTATPSRCTVTAVLTRDNYMWLDAGRNTSVYRLTITNAGPCALKDITIAVAYQPGAVLSTWSLDTTTGGYLVKGYGNTLAMGASYSAAGMIIAGAPHSVVVTTYASTCACA